MKTIGSLSILAVLLVYSAAQSWAAPSAKEQAPDSRARMMLREVGALSTSLCNTADELEMVARTQGRDQVQLEKLDALKDEVNRIGTGLRVLEAEEDSLADWERATLKEVVPLMNEIAAIVQKELVTYNAGRDHVWATAFPKETSQVYEDATRVSQIVHAQLKLAGLREHEGRMQAQVRGKS